jgi:hypothetical protein
VLKGQSKCLIATTQQTTKNEIKEIGRHPNLINKSNNSHGTGIE